MKSEPITEAVGGRGRLLLQVGLLAAALAFGFLAWKARGDTDSDLAARREQIEAMSPAEKADLQRRQQRFAALDPAEQDRIRQFHRQLQADPDSERLQAVLANYGAWLMALPASSRAELAELAPAQRQGQIRALLAEQARRQGLSRQDLAELMRFLEPLVGEQEKTFLQSLPEPHRRQTEQHLARLGPSQRSRTLLTLFLFRTQWDAPLPLPPPSAERLAELRSHLSRDLQQQLESKSTEEQWATLLGRLRQASRDGSNRELLFAVDEKELGRFFEEDLTQDQRDRLLALPAEDMLRDLRRQYWASLRPGEGPFHRPDFPSGRPGYSESGKGRSKRGSGELFPRLPRPPYSPDDEKGRRTPPSAPPSTPPSAPLSTPPEI